MSNKLKYFQQEMTLNLYVITTILLFGMNFRPWICWMAFSITIGQFFYALYFEFKVRSEGKKS